MKPSKLKRMKIKHLAVVLVAVVFVGCATQLTKLKNSAGQFLASSAMTVDTAMKGAALLEVEGVISTNDWATIANYYAHYQVAMIAATNAYTLAVSTGDFTQFAAASNNLVGAQSVLTAKTTALTPH